MKMKRIYALLLAGAMAVGTLAGCGGGADKTEDTSKTETEDSAEADGDESEDESADKATEETSISGEVQMAYWDGGQTEFYEICIEEFNKIYPDVKIILEQAPWEDYWMKLETSVTGGSSADVFWLNAANIGKYAEAGVLMPVTDLFENYGLDRANYTESLMNRFMVDGVQYGFPQAKETIGLWYNKKMFDEAGLDYPTDDWTWEDLTEAATALTKDGVYGISSDIGSGQMSYWNTIFAAGGSVISDDNTTSGYNLPETQAGIQCWVDLIEAGIHPSYAAAIETEAYIMMQSGMAAMSLQGSWYVPYHVPIENAEDFDCVELPSLNGNKATMISGNAHCIAAGTENPDAAKAWVAFLAGEEANKILAEMGSNMPVFKGMEEVWANAYPEYNLQSYITSANEYSYPMVVTTDECDQMITDNLKKVFALESDVKITCDEIAEQMNKLLANE